MEHPIHMPVFQGTEPLYLQLYQHLAREIQQGRPGAGKKLPSKRRLCAMLGVSMSTVEGAYSLLLAEGYVRSLPRSGYVAAQLHDVQPQSVPDLPPAPPPTSQWRYDCSTSSVDTTVFPFSSWARINKDAVYQNPGLLQPGHPQGDEPLRVALAGLLAQYRGVRCSPEQIVVGAGADYLLSLLLQLFPQGSTVALEDPGYPTAWQAVERHGHHPVSVPVDRDGMDPQALERSNATLAYVTPSHQFPLGVTMPVERRSRLLHWAAQAPDRYLLEDDYDSEFRYVSRPIPALQGLDHGGRVIYLGTFSRSIAPAIRVAYLILPPQLLARYRQVFPQGACTVSRFEQETLRQFLVQGLYSRHLRRSGNLYRRKCLTLSRALETCGYLSLAGQDAGLHFLLTASHLTESDMVARAAESGLRVYPLSRYCHHVSPPPSTVVVGYAGLPTQELDICAQLLCQALAPVTPAGESVPPNGLP